MKGRVNSFLQGEGRWFESSSAYQKILGKPAYNGFPFFLPSIIRFIYTVTYTIGSVIGIGAPSPSGPPGAAWSPPSVRGPVGVK